MRRLDCHSEVRTELWDTNGWVRREGSEERSWGYPKNPEPLVGSDVRSYTPRTQVLDQYKSGFFFSRWNFGKLPNGQPALIYFPCFFFGGGSTDSEFVFFFGVCEQKRWKGSVGNRTFPPCSEVDKYTVDVMTGTVRRLDAFWYPGGLMRTVEITFTELWLLRLDIHHHMTSLYAASWVMKWYPVMLHFGT